MRPYVSLWILVGLYGYLRNLMVLIGPYAAVWVLIGLFCVLMDCNGSLLLLIGPYES